MYRAGARLHSVILLCDEYRYSYDRCFTFTNVSFIATANFLRTMRFLYKNILKFYANQGYKILYRKHIDLQIITAN